jgi:hypothetical protein
LDHHERKGIPYKKHSSDVELVEYLADAIPGE